MANKRNSITAINPNTNNRNFIIVIFVYVIYSRDKKIHKIEYINKDDLYYCSQNLYIWQTNIYLIYVCNNNHVLK